MNIGFEFFLTNLAIASYERSSDNTAFLSSKGLYTTREGTKTLSSLAIF